jgi:hypothetical protein
MRTLILVLTAVVLSATCSAQTKAKAPADKPDTSHLEFVTEYLRELSAIEDIRVSGEKKLKQDPANTFSGAIHTSTLFQLELGS